MTSVNLPPGPVPPLRGTAILAGTDRARLVAGSTLLTLTSLRRVDPDAVPTRPWYLADQRLWTVLEATPETERRSLELVLRGLTVLMSGAGTGGPPHFLDALGRHSRIIVWDDEPAAALSVDQISLLDRLRRGNAVGAAASELGLSDRTAHRRLTDARSLLGAPTTTAACTALGSVLRTLDP